jgi:uncharacterized membrane protein
MIHFVKEFVQNHPWWSAEIILFILYIVSFIMMLNTSPVSKDGKTDSPRKIYKISETLSILFGILCVILPLTSFLVWLIRSIFKL